MRLPNGERAFIDPAKLTGYVLNPHHPRGRNKARVFLATLSLSPDGAGILASWLTDLAATSAEAVETGEDVYGRRFEICAEMRYAEHVARIVTAWIIRRGEDFPRLVTAFVE